MVLAINNEPPHLTNLGHEKVHTTLLEREKKFVEGSWKPIRDYWVESSFSIVSDGWIDCKIIFIDKCYCVVSLKCDVSKAG